MHLFIHRELLFKAINLIFKAADRRHNMVILGNLKLEVSEQSLVLTASDLELELTAQVRLPEGACAQAGAITLPAGKLRDICKLLPNEANIELKALPQDRCQISSGKSQFTLGILPAKDFPSMGEPVNITSLNLSLLTLADLISKTQFAMAIQDVRYYLTGMLFELAERQLTTVATDGHRLALARSAVEVDDSQTLQAILPRKAVQELDRLITELGKLLAGQDKVLTLSFGREFFQVSLPFGQVDTSTGQVGDEMLVTFTARLIDGKFPDYRRVMPSQSDKRVLVKQDLLVDVLRRVAILSNEKSRGVIFKFDPNGDIEVRANNAEQDEAIEQLQGNYQGEGIELSFNAAYLQDVLEVLQGEVELHMTQANASVLVNQLGDQLRQYVVMPMRL